MPQDPPAWVLDRRQRLGQRLREARLEVDLTQERLAEYVGVDRRTIQAIEAGTSDPRYGWLLLCADACHTTVADLLVE